MRAEGGAIEGGGFSSCIAIRGCARDEGRRPAVARSGAGFVVVELRLFVAQVKLEKLRVLQLFAKFIFSGVSLSQQFAILRHGVVEVT